MSADCNDLSTGAMDEKAAIGFAWIVGLAAVAWLLMMATDRAILVREQILPGMYGGTYCTYFTGIRVAEVPSKSALGCPRFAKIDG